MRTRETSARNSYVKSNIYRGRKRRAAFKRGKYNGGGGNVETQRDVERDVKKGEPRVGHTPAFLESSLSGRAAAVVTGGGHEISEEKHVSKSESIATMLWRRERERGLALS